VSNIYFIGQAKTAIDEKGRTSFPREFRRQLPEDEARNLVATIGPNRTLHVYTRVEFREFVAKLERRANTPQNTIFKQRILGNAVEVELDGQNRITLSKALLQYADLKDEVVFVGEGLKIVMWNPVAHERVMGFNSEASFAEFDQAYYDADSEGVGENG